MSFLEAFQQFSNDFKMEQWATRNEMQKVHVELKAFNAYVHQQEKEIVLPLSNSPMDNLKLQAKLITSKKINLFILEFQNPEKKWILYKRFQALITKTTHIQRFRYLKLYNYDYLMFI